jgi:DNA-binding NarL/FixJ family response regulator
MNYKLLIVDDSKLARMAVIRVMTTCCPDWQRIEAGSAADALKAVREEKPHVALVDFNMPNKDGLALAADLRALTPDMPIGIISANHQQEVVDRARALGATFLPKPVTEAALREFVTSASRRLQGAAS